MPSSSAARGKRIRRRRLSPTDSSTTAASDPSIRPPISVNRGAYGELDPPDRNSGATRAPTRAPTAKPVSENALTTSPCRYPHTAISTTKATMTQSRVVICANSRYRVVAMEETYRPLEVKRRDPNLVRLTQVGLLLAAWARC